MIKRDITFGIPGKFLVILADFPVDGARYSILHVQFEYTVGPRCIISIQAEKNQARRIIYVSINKASLMKSKIDGTSEDYQVFI